MGWLLGCFKCRQRRSTSSSINLTTSCKDGRSVSSSALLLSADSAQAKESIEVETFLSVQGDESKRNSSTCIKAGRRSHSSRRPSSEQLLQVEKLEEEIDSLNRKLVEEATQATSLANEVRHLRNCSALLDSPNAFRKALNALEQALEKGYVEESQPLLYLQSLLSKIEPSEEVADTSLEERDEERLAKGFFECIDVSSSATKKGQKSSEKAHDKAVQAEPDRSQGNICTSVTIRREPDETQKLMPNDEQSICNSRQRRFSDVVDHDLSAVVDQDTNKSQLISVAKRRSSKTLSFSGFLLVEGVAETRPTSDKSGAGEHFSSTEFAVTKIIEKTDLSSENLVEVSKSLFAFSTDNFQGHPTVTAQADFGNISKDFSFLNSDSEADSCSEKPKGNGRFSNLCYSSPSCLWSPQDDNTHEVDRACCSLSAEQCQIDAIETSRHRFSDADGLSLLSTFFSSSTDHVCSSSLDSEELDSEHSTKASQMHTPSVTDNASAKRKVNSHATVQALGMTQPKDIGDTMARSCCNASCWSLTEVQVGSVTSSMDKSVDLCPQCAASVDLLKGCIAQGAGSEVIKYCLTRMISEGQMGNTCFETTNQGKSVFFENLMHASYNEAPLNKITSNEKDSRYGTSHLTSPCLLQGQFSILGGEATVELASPGTTSIWSPDKSSLYAVNTPSPMSPIGSIRGCPLGFLSETPSTPVSMNSHESRLHFTKADAVMPKFTPLRTPLTSLTQEAETPTSTMHSQGSPSSLSEDRPILGTVAAHWNPSSTSSTQKWWDGKGIPNSTNKYKEDQKVSWHATPFEVRLERALAKQGRVFQKLHFCSP